jgi:xylulokinase
MYLLGYDIGSSSVKASLVDVNSGDCVATAFFPKQEMEIRAVKSGWAEQDPQSWWSNLKLATREVLSISGVKSADIKAIGISYQMHGLVCIDKNHEVLRPSIIWCDSRAVDYGAKAFSDFMVAPDVQKIISEFGVDKYGAPLFFPDAGKTEAELGSV